MGKLCHTDREFREFSAMLAVVLNLGEVRAEGEIRRGARVFFFRFNNVKG